MKQPEGFVEPGFEDYVCKLIHMIYGMMQGLTTGIKPSAKLITISGMPPHVRIHVFDSRKKMGTILSWTHTRTMSLGHQMMRRRRREERRRLAEYGKIKTWGRMSISLG